MLHNNVFTYWKVSSFEKKELNHRRTVRKQFHSYCCQIKALHTNGRIVSISTLLSLTSVYLQLWLIAWFYIQLCLFSSTDCEHFFHIGNSSKKNWQPCLSSFGWNSTFCLANNLLDGIMYFTMHLSQVSCVKSKTSPI